MRTTHPLHPVLSSRPSGGHRPPMRGVIGWAFAAWLAAFIVVVTLAAKVGADETPHAGSQTGPVDQATTAGAATQPATGEGARTDKAASITAERAMPVFPAGYAPKPAGTQATAKPNAQSQAPVGGDGLMSMAVPLAVVVAVIFIAAAVFQRVLRAGGHLTSGVRAPSGIMEMLGRYPVGRGQNLLLIKLDQRVLLIGQTLPARNSAGSLSTLTELADGEDVASILLKISESESAGPAGKFNKLLREHEGDEAPAKGARAIARKLFGGSGAVVWDETLLKQEPVQPHATGDVQERLARLKAASRSGKSVVGGGVA